MGRLNEARRSVYVTATYLQPEPGLFYRLLRGAVQNTPSHLQIIDIAVHFFVLFVGTFIGWEDFYRRLY